MVTPKIMLRSPYRAIDLSKIKDKSPSESQCPPPPLPVHILNTSSIYTDGDKTRSVIDIKSKQKYDKSMSELIYFNQRVAQFANSAKKQPYKAKFHARCVISWIASWAKEDSLKLSSKTALIGIGPYMSGISLSYMQIANIIPQDPRHAIIKPWLKKVIKQSITHFNKYPDARSSNNNLRYWAGLAATSIGVVNNDKKLFDWGITSIRLGIKQIESDGTLPLETMRSGRATLYHLHAVAPLIMAAELATINGIDLYSENEEALHKLVIRSAKSAIDDEYFTQKTGTKQTPITNKPHISAWSVIYSSHFPNKNQYVEQLKQQNSRNFSSNLGGNLSNDLFINHNSTTE